jgi:hypothetical protein
MRAAAAAAAVAPLPQHRSAATTTTTAASSAIADANHTERTNERTNETANKRRAARVCRTPCSHMRAARRARAVTRCEESLWARSGILHVLQDDATRARQLVAKNSQKKFM